MQATKQKLIYKKIKNDKETNEITNDVIKLRKYPGEEEINKIYQETIFDPDRQVLRRLIFKFVKLEDSTYFIQALRMILIKNNSNVKIIEEVLVSKLIKHEFTNSIFESIVD